MTGFEFKTDADSREFCESILRAMVDLFGITENEALGRMNKAWRGLEFVGEDIIYHELEEYWAKTIYYGSGSYWWMDPPDLKPLPYP